MHLTSLDNIGVRLPCDEARHGIGHDQMHRGCHVSFASQVGHPMSVTQQEGTERVRYVVLGNPGGRHAVHPRAMRRTSRPRGGPPGTG